MKREDIHFDRRMSRWTHQLLLNHIVNTLHPDACDGTLDCTEAFLRTQRVDVDAALAWLKSLGAECDCSVVDCTLWDDFQWLTVH